LEAGLQILESSFVLVVVNAHHLKVVPGRKTDVRDAEWIADLLRHGLVSPSFIPSRPERELRELTRYRTSLVAERAAELNRIQKVLEGANIKLASVVSEIDGLSARAMLAAMLSGEYDVAEVAALARGKLRRKQDGLKEALYGHLQNHQRFLIAIQLRHLDEMEALIAEVSDEVAGRLEAAKEDLERLTTIPGVSRRLSEILLSEMGADMSRFPSPRHLASWAGLCPGNNRVLARTSPAARARAVPGSEARSSKPPSRLTN
jgi:transposase